MDQTPIPSTEPETPAEPLSIADHGKTFGPQATEETAAEVTERLHHSAEQKREKESGKFTEGKVRHRAKSQQASPEDVPRIQALTGRAKAAEERATALEAEVARLKASHAPTATIAKAEAKVEAAGDDPEPKDDDPKYAGDYAKYLREAARWDARQEFEAAHQRQQAAEARRQQETSERELVTTWQGRVTAAQAVYPDFAAVAFSPTPIPKDSLMDRWIMEEESGAHVLYWAQSHPEERDEILRLPALQQAKRLALLSQRFSSSETVQAGTTGSAASSSLKVPPRPPNPVRTDAQSAPLHAPPTDGSLSIAEHGKAFGRKSRR